jgi:hypothetical protein
LYDLEKVLKILVKLEVKKAQPIKYRIELLIDSSPEESKRK